MYKAIVDYYDILDRKNPKSKIIDQEKIKGSTEIEVFEKFYSMNNSLRYCNDSYYKFQSKIWNEKYLAWLESDDYKKKSFDLYYGNGTVD